MRQISRSLAVLSQSHAEEESDKVQSVPHTCTLFFITFHTLSFGFVDLELSYDSSLTAGALSHTLLPLFLALLVNCMLSQVDHSLTGNYYQSTSLPAEFCISVSISPFPHSCSSFQANPCVMSCFCIGSECIPNILLILCMG